MRPAGIVSVLFGELRGGEEGGSRDVFVKKLGVAEFGLCGYCFRDPALVAVDVDVGHCEGFGGETEGVGH